MHQLSNSIINNKTQLANIVDDNYVALERGDIIISDTSEDIQGIGKFGFIERPLKHKTVAGLHTIALKPKQIYPDYLAIYLTTHRFKHFSYQKSYGLKIYTFPYDEMKQFSVWLPPINEQKQIVQPFSLIYKESHLYEEKINYLKSFKSALLNKFIEENIKNKSVKLSEVCIRNNKTIIPSKTPEKIFREYSLLGLDKKKIFSKSGQEIKSQRFLLNGPCILFNKLNIQKRRVWNIKSLESNSIASVEFIVLEPKHINPDYLAELLVSDYFTRQVLRLLAGSSNSQKRVIPTDLLQLRIPIVSSEKEQILVKQMHLLEDLIFEQKEKVAQLKQLKQLLLQKLFI